MKFSWDERSKLLLIVYRGLIIILVFLGLVFIGGTIYGVFFNNSSLNVRQVEAPRKDGEGQPFTGIGRIRVSTNDPQPGMVIISVSFIYYPGDRAFFEELALRMGDFRGIIADYIGSFPAAELQKLSEESLKTELLRRFNAILRLGKIEVIYFSDFMIISP